MTARETRDLIVAARKQAGLTQEEATKMLNITKNKFTRFESGLYCFTVEELNKIADLYDCVFEGEFTFKKKANPEP